MSNSFVRPAKEAAHGLNTVPLTVNDGSGVTRTPPSTASRPAPRSLTPDACTAALFLPRIASCGFGALVLTSRIWEKADWEVWQYVRNGSTIVNGAGFLRCGAPSDLGTA